MNKFTWVLIILGISIFVIEYICLKNQYEFAPSYFLRNIRDSSIDFFVFLGRMIAMISSVLNYIDFDDIFETLQRLLLPLIDILSSPIMIIVGYISEAAIIAAEFYTKPFVIYLGSFLIIILSFVLFFKYPPMNFIRNLKERMFRKETKIHRE